MKKTKLLSMAVTVVMAVSMFGCGSKEAAKSADSGAESKSKTKKFVLCMSHMDSDFPVEMSNAIKKKADELGVKVTVYDAQNDAAKQMSQIEQAITQGVDGIMVEPASVDGIIPGIKQAMKAKIPVVTVNQKISDQSAASCYVGADPVEGGTVEITQALKDIGGKGNLAFLLGPLGTDAQIGRTKGYTDTIAKTSGVTVVEQNTANWDTAQAMKLVENWIQKGSKIDAIVANNDNMALGAIRALQGNKLDGKVKVYGLDATKQGLEAVKAGTMAATISQGTAEQGSKGMEACYKLANGETVDKEIIIKHTVITKDNVDQYLK